MNDLIPRPTRKIAVVRALHLGDLLLAVPALRSLRAAFPEAEITLIGLPWAREIVRRFGHYVDRLVEFPGYPGLLEVEYEPARTEAFLAEQRSYGYDLVLQMHGNGRASLPFALDLGGRCTAGHYVDSPPTGLTIGWPYPDGFQEILRVLSVVEMLDIPSLGTALEFPLLPDDWLEARRILEGNSLVGHRLVGVHVGARPPARRWPQQSFAVLADQLVRQTGGKIVLTGGPGEEEMVLGVQARMSAPAVSLVGKMSIGGLGALIKQMTLFVGNDTGPAHIATALDVPSVTIFGPADPVRWAPLDQSRHRIVRRPVECSPCVYWDCPIDHRCLRWIAPEDVAEACLALLAEVGR